MSTNVPVVHVKIMQPVKTASTLILAYVLKDSMTQSAEQVTFD